MPTQGNARLRFPQLRHQYSGELTCVLFTNSLTAKWKRSFVRLRVRFRPHAREAPSIHQQPDVNYIQVLEKVDFPCTVHAQRVPFKGNQLRAETGLIVHFWLLVDRRMRHDGETSLRGCWRGHFKESLHVSVVAGYTFQNVPKKSIKTLRKITSGPSTFYNHL